MGIQYQIDENISICLTNYVFMYVETHINRMLKNFFGLHHVKSLSFNHNFFVSQNSISFWQCFDLLKLKHLFVFSCTTNFFFLKKHQDVILLLHNNNKYTLCACFLFFFMSFSFLFHFFFKCYLLKKIQVYLSTHRFKYI